MGFSSPFAVDAQTYPASMQRLANSAIAPDVSGVIGVSDMLVRGLGVGGVSVDPGAAIIANTYPLATFRQSYLVSNDAADDDAIIVPPAAGSGSDRTDYLIYRIYDEEYAGQVDPTGKGGGLVLVPALPTTYPFVALAEITQPAGNTAGIQQSMITDLRQVANPNLERAMVIRPAVAGDAGLTLTQSMPVGETFPNIGVSDIKIPFWASQMQMIANWDAVAYTGGNTWGYYWVEYGPQTGPSSRKYSSQQWAFDSNGALQNQRLPWRLADQKTIPRELRGTTQRFILKAGYDPASTTKSVQLTPTSGVSLEVWFMQIADPDVTIVA